MGQVSGALPEAMQMLTGATTACLYGPMKRSRSNHVIGHKMVYPVGQSGLWRYEIHAYLPGTIDQEGETGPEFSL